MSVEEHYCVLLTRENDNDPDISSFPLPDNSLHHHGIFILFQLNYSHLSLQLLTISLAVVKNNIRYCVSYRGFLFPTDIL